MYSQALLDQHHHHDRTFANNNVALEVNPVAVRELEHGEEPRLRCSRHPVVPGEDEGEDWMVVMVFLDALASLKTMLDIN